MSGGWQILAVLLYSAFVFVVLVGAFNPMRPRSQAECDAHNATQQLPAFGLIVLLVAAAAPLVVLTAAIAMMIRNSRREQ